MSCLKARERFAAVLNMEKPDDRLPKFEFATWWDQTIARWYEEGLEASVDASGLNAYFGHDIQEQFWLAHRAKTCPSPAYHGAGLIEDAEDYERIKEHLYPVGAVSSIRDRLNTIKLLHDSGDMMVWMTLEGYFWFPRTLFGIEGHLFSFYDQEALYHQICRDLCEWQLKMIDEFCEILCPEFMTIAEDMSYNHGPMLSREMFERFVAPYYAKVIPALHRHGIKVFVDTDGDMTQMIDWLLDAGVDGLCPLERQAGVDVCQIKKDYPSLLLIGGFDKTVMRKGEAAMRAEFERLLPAIRVGGYIPSVDHQTPPDVSLQNYRIYCGLLDEYMCFSENKCRSEGW